MHKIVPCYVTLLPTPPHPYNFSNLNIYLYLAIFLKRGGGGGGGGVTDGFIYTSTPLFRFSLAICSGLMQGLWRAVI